MPTRTAAFDALEAILEDNPEDRELSNRLQRDPRMEAAWRSWDRLGADSATLETALAFVGLCKTAADCGRTVEGHLRAEQIDVEGALSRLQWLGEYLGKNSRVLGDLALKTGARERDVATRLAEDLKRVSRHLLQLQDMVDYLSDQLLGTLHDVVNMSFPTSQKLNPEVRFQILYSEALQQLVGQPLYSFVATVSDVVFEKRSETSKDAVRQAYARERKRRREGRGTVSSGSRS